MTATIIARPVAPIAEPRHVHTRTCYWDCREARWQCAGPRAEAAVSATARRR